MGGIGYSGRLGFEGVGDFEIMCVIKRFVEGFMVVCRFLVWVGVDMLCEVFGFFVIRKL